MTNLARKCSDTFMQMSAFRESNRVFNIPTETEALAEAAHREVQRRAEASIEHAAGLPPDVVAMLTMFDALEKQKEESFNAAHKRFADSINRFFDKLRTEETKYNNRMDELQVCRAGGGGGGGRGDLELCSILVPPPLKC